MTPRQQNMTGRARESVEKVAYAAVGAPSAALKALSAKVSELRDAARATGEDMSSGVAREIKAWVGRGEQVIERAMAKLRDSDVADGMRNAAHSTKDVATTGIEKASEVAGSALDFIAPDEPTTTISGIGPTNAATLADAGVSGISALLERSRTQDSVAELAETTGFSPETIQGWRDQADLTRVTGIGDSYQRLLRRVGIWTHRQLADADSNDLAARMRDVGLPDTPDQLPGPDVVDRWRKEARKLTR